MLIIAQPKYGSQVECWTSGGIKKLITVPVEPHFYSLKKHRNLKNTRVSLKLLSTLQERDLWHITLKRRNDIYDLRDENSLEANIPWMHVLHSLFRWKQDDKNITHSAFDIEVSATKGQFPNPKYDPITAISLFSKSNQKALLGEESEIIHQFIDIIRKDDPDVIDHYNGGRFDFPYLLRRAHLNGIHLGIDRKGKEPQVKKRTFIGGYRKGVDYTVYMNGRISFDVWKEVRFDTSLTGKIKNKQLKTVAKYFFGKKYIVEVNRAKMNELSKKELHEYALSDARVTWLLADHYLRLLTYLAVKLEVPLDFIVLRSPSHIGNIIYGRKFKEIGIISDGSNADRFIGVLWDG